MTKLIMITFFFCLQIAFAQEKSEIDIDKPDSSSTTTEIEKLQFDIKLLQIERELISKMQLTPDSSLFQEIVFLKTEANTFYRQAEYQFANLILDEIRDLLEFHQSEQIHQTQFNLNDDITPSNPVFNKKWQINYDVISGIDLWQQQFEMNLGYADTVLSEGFNNPYLGIQVNFGQHDFYNSPFQADLTLKESHDYFSTNGNLQFSSKSEKTSLDLRNFFDGTFYQKDTYLSYFQNNLSLDWRFRPTAQHRYYLMGEFIFRNYQNEEQFTASYFQNQFRGGFDFQIFENSLGLGLRYLARNYPYFTYKNYRKSRVDLTTEVVVEPYFKFSIRNETTFKNYDITTPDSLYQSDYLENIIYLEFKYNLNNKFYLLLSTTSQFQKYQNQVAYLRDNLGFEMELSANYSINAATSFKLGGLYELIQFQGVKNEDDIPPNVENYYAPGIIFSLDYFLFDRIILSVVDTYRWRRYPNAENLNMLSLFSNRDNNSLFLLLNWQIGAGYQLNLMANYDTERDREIEHSDSKNTLFSMELTKRF